MNWTCDYDTLVAGVIDTTSVSERSQRFRPGCDWSCGFDRLWGWSNYPGIVVDGALILTDVVSWTCDSDTLLTGPVILTLVRTQVTIPTAVRTLAAILTDLKTRPVILTDVRTRPVILTQKRM